MKISIKDFEGKDLSKTIFSARYTELSVEVDILKSTITYVVRNSFDLEPSICLYSTITEEEAARFTNLFKTTKLEEAVDYFNFVQELVEQQKLIRVVYA